MWVDEEIVHAPYAARDQESSASIQEGVTKTFSLESPFVSLVRGWSQRGPASLANKGLYRGFRAAQIIFALANVADRQSISVIQIFNQPASRIDSVATKRAPICLHALHHHWRIDLR